MDKFNSIYVKSQVPAYIRDDPNYSKFIEFLESYYNWFDENYHFLNFNENIDVDYTLDIFANNLAKDFLPSFPSDIATDKVKLLKIAKEFYTAKGTPNSFKFLFRALFESDITITNNKDFVLIASGGTWIAPKSIKIKSTAEHFLTINNYKVFGTLSKTFAIIDYSVIDGKFIRLYISDVKRLFLSGEPVEILDSNNIPVYYINGEYVAYKDNPPIGAIKLDTKIVGALAHINVDSKFRGQYYQIGDPVVITGGLLQDVASPIGAVAEVSEITSGGIQDVEVINGSYGYTYQSDVHVYSGTTEINTTNIQVNLLDESKPISTTMCSSLIDWAVNSNVTIGAANYDLLIANSYYGTTEYGFANTLNNNANSTLANTLSFITQNTYPLVALYVVDGGSGFTDPPVVDVDSYFYSLDSKISIRSIGILAPIQIANSGIGYSNTDIITIDHGYGGEGALARIDSVNGLGGITAVSYYTSNNYLFPLGGMGYKNDNLPTVSISSVGGSGASLVVPCILDSGATYDIATYKIGEITSITLLDEGEDYVSTPNVSLRIIDAAISNVSTPIYFTYPDSYIYQGTDYSTASFIGKIDSLNPLNTTANSILDYVYYSRIYDFKGSLIPNTALHYYNPNYPDYTETYKFESEYSFSHNSRNSSNGYIVYGNSLAKATAKFLNGIIIEDGVYFDTKSLLDESSVLAGENYNDKTYVLSVEQQSFDEYKQSMSDLVHPVGTKVLTKNIIKNYITNSDSLSSNVALEVKITANYSMFGDSNGYSNSVNVYSMSAGLFDSYFVANTIFTMNSNTTFIHSKITATDTPLRIIYLSDYSFIGIANTLSATSALVTTSYV